MKIRFKWVMALFCLAITALLFCPQAGAEQGAYYYPIRVENPEGLRLFFVKSHIQNGDLVVSGKVRRSAFPGPVASRINVSVTGPRGQVAAEQSVTYSPPFLSRHRRHDEARFSASFEGIPERGSLIRVCGIAADKAE